jgi:predicted N-acyltransferase
MDHSGDRYKRNGSQEGEQTGVRLLFESVMMEKMPFLQRRRNEDSELFSCYGGMTGRAWRQRYLTRNMYDRLDNLMLDRS